MSRFWCSWEQPTDDFRPMNWPPDKRLLGYWVSGETSTYYTLCAVVDAKDEADCRAAIEKEWHEFCVEDWRFLEERPDDFRPGDRFPLSEWMEERFAKPVGD